MCRKCVILMFVVLGAGMVNSASALYLKVDFAYPVMVPSDPCFVARFDLTAKDGWFPWADPSFKDCWRHDRTWCATYPDVGELPGGVNGTGINFQVDSGNTYTGIISEGGKRFAAYGMQQVTDGGYATGHPLGEPIANSGMSTFDGSGETPKRSVVLVIHGLGPGTYYLESYHNCGWDVNDPYYNNTDPALGYYNVPDINMAKIWIRGPDVNQVVTPEDFPIQREQVDANLVLVTAVFTKTDVCDCNVAFMPGPGGKVMVNAFILSTGKWYAREPDPENEAINFCPGSSLCWTSDSTVEFHDVYIGTAWADVNDATTSTSGIYKERLTGEETCYTPEDLQLGMTYYWRIDAISDVNLWKGEVWSFTTNDGNAYDPYPADDATKIPLDINSFSWTVGCSAATHDVFFGTSAADVNSATTSSHPNVSYTAGTAPGSYTPPGPLAFATHYYWRVDEVSSGGGQRWHGKVWHFKTKAEITDPSLLVRYQFDELPPSSIAFDSSGNEFTGTISGDPNAWAPTDGRFGGCRIFGGSCSLPADVPKTITSAITISMWLKDIPTNSDPGWNNVVLDASSSIVFWRMRVLVPSNQGRDDDWPGYILWRAGMEPNDRLSWNLDGIKIEQLDGWHHWVFIKDEPNQTVQIYFDGVLGASATGSTISNLASMYPNNILICGNQGSGGGSATVDDFRIYNRALSESEVLEVLRGDDLWSAWLPQPQDGAVEVAPDVNLTWRPGDYAVQHKVFFGADWDDVNDMTDPCATLGVGNEEYDPGWLEFSTTYYWRVDEVNGPNTWKGPVWRFTVADFIVLDDFEQYDLDQKSIQYTWYDQYSQEYGQQTGAWLELAKPPKPVHGDDQAMSYTYDTDDVWADYYYAEAWLPLEEIGGFQDWTSVDVRLLTLFFYGQADNDATEDEQMYAAVDDTWGTYAEMRYGDNEGEALGDLLIEEWQSWDIPFAYFSDGNFAAVADDVDFSIIRNVYIGFGNKRFPVAAGKGVVYFDDIRVSMPICKPEYGPVGDFDDDCIIGIGDIGVMGEQWLRGDIDVTPIEEPGTANLVGHWALDGNANDSSANPINGTAQGAYAWVSGHIGSGAIELSGGKVLVADGAKLRPALQISATAWINYSEEMSQIARIVIKGIDAGDSENFAMQLGGSACSFFVRDVNHGLHSADGDNIARGEWAHVAGTYDGNSVKCYVNGQVSNSETIGVITLLQDTNDLAIGNRSDADDRAFIGTVDDVRVYNRALTRAEVGWLASEGEGVVELTSEVNLFIDDPAAEVINFKDFAKLMESWGVEQLWPPEP
ncbi:MAG TPA: LamG domain-containing protein [Sedimentisphaerales bacterium]|nr:LamG domain-containing protein [Sedimentisphaerales bacterium]